MALIPVTGGIFTVTLTTSLSKTTSPTQQNDDISGGPDSHTADEILWDRKVEGGFPETKELKNRVRNVIQPERDLGHIDRSLKKTTKIEDENHVSTSRQADATTAGTRSTQTDPMTAGARSTQTDPTTAGSKQRDAQECADCP